MNFLLGLIILILFLSILVEIALLLLGLIIPNKISTKIFRRDLTRKRLSVIFTGFIVGSFVLIGVIGSFIPDSQSVGNIQTTTSSVSNADTTGEVQGDATNSATNSVSTADASKISYPVTSIVDGDTIKVLIDGKQESVRLVGIDTPETVDPRKPVQCFGKEAKEKMEDLVTSKTVFLEVDETQSNRDKYNRLLRFVFLEEGTDVGLSMISEGFASEYTYQNNPYKYRDSYIKAESEARANKVGLWADDACPTPTNKPANTPTPTIKKVVLPTSKPTIATVYVAPTSVPIPTSPPAVNPGASFSCNCSKTCPNMASCEEAYFQLNNCGCKVRDGDDDGVPCEDICLGG